MIVVVAFCAKDADLQRRNLEWALELDSGCGREGVLSYDTLTPKDAVAAIQALAERYFTKVHHCCYSEPPVKGWPAACNWAWQSTARWMFDAPLKQPWLWLEADAMPLKSGWVHEIEAAHVAAGKNFSGHVVKDMGHMNGVGVYPWDVMRRNEMAMLTRAAAWDVVLKESTKNDCAPLNHLIQHAWNVHPIDRTMIWNGEGQPVSFKSQEDVGLYLDFNAVLLHRIKDGSLIPLLRERALAAQEKQRLIMSTDYNVPQHTKHENQDSHIVEKRTIQAGVSVLEKDTERLPKKNGTGPAVNVLIVTKPQNQKFTGKCEIFIVTYGLPTKRPTGLIVSDFDWLVWCLRSIRRWCSGFSGITLAIPSRDAELLKPISKEHANAGSGIPLRIRMYEEREGKGHIHHMAIMASSDNFTPGGTTHVLHVDADCIFKAAVTPEAYITGERPVYVVRTYESLAHTRNGQKVVSDCAQWFTPTAKQLGFDPDMYSMCVIPACFPIGFYKPYREHVEKQHATPYVDYMLSGRNEFPPDRMDFVAMGAWAWRFMHDSFDWRDISGGNHLAPMEYHKNFWSHSGIKPETKTEIEGFLK